MKVTLIIFSLNEIDGMKVIMPKIKPQWYDELIIIDGNSTDGTIEYARQHGYRIILQKEKGYGAAFMEAIENSIGDLLVFLSPDGNSMPELIPELVKKVNEGYDMVTASRYLDGARSYDDDMITAFGNHFFTAAINLLFGVRLTDALVMYRVYKRDILRQLNIDPKSGSCGTQILLRTIKRKLRVGEIPGDEPPRIGGVRKMHPLKNGLGEIFMIAREFLWR